MTSTFHPTFSLPHTSSFQSRERAYLSIWIHSKHSVWKSTLSCPPSPVQTGPSWVDTTRPVQLCLPSIKLQTDWCVTPLAGPRLHFSSPPSLPLHSFFSTVTFSVCFHPDGVRILYQLFLARPPSLC